MKLQDNCSLCHVTVAPYDPDRLVRWCGDVVHGSCMVSRGDMARIVHETARMLVQTIDTVTARVFLRRAKNVIRQPDHHVMRREMSRLLKDFLLGAWEYAPQEEEKRRIIVFAGAMEARLVYYVVPDELASLLPHRQQGRNGGTKKPWAEMRHGTSL